MHGNNNGKFSTLENLTQTKKNSDNTDPIEEFYSMESLEETNPFKAPRALPPNRNPSQNMLLGISRQIENMNKQMNIF